ncbi:polyamine-modulated factor 1-like [Montipora foliosa]|uniref:polyamine-modulated factor 1-like n=1 Tax=Montipora foliosa TaxID=591990 RepID=UPI0035F1CAC7
MAAEIEDSGSVSQLSTSPSLKESSTFEKRTEIEGRRMESFRKVMNKCLDKIMAAGSQEKFNRCFTSIRERNPLEFKSIVEQLMQQLRSNIEKEIDLMIKQEDLVYFFNELDYIVEDSVKGKSQPAWRPSGNPRKDLCDHVMQVKLAYKTQITSMLEKLEEENEKLTSDVLQKREKLVDTEKQLVENTEHLREVAAYCTENPLHKLQEQCVLLNSNTQMK